MTEGVLSRWNILYFFFLEVNKVFRALFTLSSELPWSYISTTNLSISGMTFSTSAAVGAWASLCSAGETSVNLPHVVQAVHLPLPAKDDVVLQPVRAWQTGNT